MRIGLFSKLFVISLAVSLLAFAVVPEATVMFLLKAIALGLGFSILITVVYPGLRGIRRGDSVSVISNSVLPSIFGKGGVALTTGKLNSEVRIRLDDGREAVGVIESYDGMLSLPRVRLLYEEKLVE